ncbi:MAG: hypothetical protein U0168_14155 [Nannocystaceae bacterium]
MRRLQAEARALARLSPPHVVAVHGVGRFGDEVASSRWNSCRPTFAAWLRAATRPLASVLEVLLAAGDRLAGGPRSERSPRLQARQRRCRRRRPRARDD